MSDETDMDALFASLESAAEEVGATAVGEGDGTTPEEPEWVPPYVVDVDLPMDVSIALDELVSSVQQFADTARAFLESDHLDVAGIAQQLTPVGSAEEYPAAEEELSTWQATIDGRTKGLTALMAAVDDDRQVLREYSDRMAEIFAGAPPAPQPPPPPPPPEDEGPGDDEPAMTPV